MFATGQVVRQIKLKPNCLVGLVLKASLCHKSKLPPRKVYQWPYDKVYYSYTTFLWDPLCAKKFGENSKVIQIDGNIESGKEDFGKRLADQLGMKYFGPPDLEGYYINGHGYDYRALNPLLPERLRMCDWEMFHESPNRHSVGLMQLYLIKLRLYNYILAMRHLYNTGQGVILNRSVFTEKIIVDAMHELGWLPHGYLRGDGMQFYDFRHRYDYVRNMALHFIQKPHVTIYLDTPVETCLERIKKSDDPMIANSKAHTPEFLEAIEECADNILDRQEQNGHVIRLDYKKRLTDGELGDFVDDLERLDFTYDQNNTQFESWDVDNYFFFHFVWRRFYTSFRSLAEIEKLDQPWFDIAGLGDSITNADLVLRRVLFERHVGELGLFTSRAADIKKNGFFGALLDLENFGNSYKKYVHTDFV